MADLTITKDDINNAVKDILKSIIVPQGTPVTPTVLSIPATTTTIVASLDPSIPPGAVVPIPEPTPKVSVPWYGSRTFSAMVQTTVLTSLGWLVIALQANDFTTWKIGLLLPIVSNLFIVFRDMWSSTIVGPSAIMNVNNVPPKVQSTEVGK